LKELVLTIPFIPLIIAGLIGVINNKEAIPRISMFFSAFIAILP
jgi:NADH-quinone oxidoreductase subunit L